MASIPQREHLLQKSLLSAVGQVDIMYLFLNGYDHIPSFVPDNVIVEITDNSKGVSIKMSKVSDHEGLYFCFDDDLEYKDNYVSILSYFIELHGDSVIGLHGAKYPMKGWDDFKYYCVKNLDIVNVDIIGTGVCGFNTRYVSPPMDIFIYPNKVDLQFSRWCLLNNIKKTIIPHPSNLVINLDPKEETPSLRSQTNRHEKTLWREDNVLNIGK